MGLRPAAAKPAPPEPIIIPPSKSPKSEENEEKEEAKEEPAKEKSEDGEEEGDRQERSMRLNITTKILKRKKKFVNEGYKPKSKFLNKGKDTIYWL